MDTHASDIIARVKNLLSPDPNPPIVSLSTPDNTHNADIEKPITELCFKLLEYRPPDLAKFPFWTSVGSIHVCLLDMEHAKNVSKVVLREANKSLSTSMSQLFSTLAPGKLNIAVGLLDDNLTSYMAFVARLFNKFRAIKTNIMHAITGFEGPGSDWIRVQYGALTGMMARKRQIDAEISDLQLRTRTKNFNEVHDKLTAAQIIKAQAVLRQQYITGQITRIKTLLVSLENRMEQETRALDVQLRQLNSSDRALIEQYDFQKQQLLLGSTAVQRSAVSTHNTVQQRNQFSVADLASRAAVLPPNTKTTTQSSKGVKIGPFGSSSSKSTTEEVDYSKRVEAMHDAHESLHEAMKLQRDAFVAEMESLAKLFDTYSRDLERTVRVKLESSERQRDQIFVQRLELLNQCWTKYQELYAMLGPFEERLLQEQSTAAQAQNDIEYLLALQSWAEDNAALTAERLTSESKALAETIRRTRAQLEQSLLEHGWVYSESSLQAVMIVSKLRGCIRWRVMSHIYSAMSDLEIHLQYLRDNNRKLQHVKHLMTSASLAVKLQQIHPNTGHWQTVYKISSLHDLHSLASQTPFASHDTATVQALKGEISKRLEAQKSLVAYLQSLQVV